MSQVRVGVVGGSGYIGGELVRLLLQHPTVSLTQVTSERQLVWRNSNSSVNG
jgi:N-acetyl-gamma-glutamyl-phosphate/LysW-gamma-L-alpha-aminoadipyl-6-phosphate reductase